MKKIFVIFLLMLFLSPYVCAKDVKDTKDTKDAIITDDFVERTLKGSVSSAQRLPVYVSPVELITTKDKKLYEGKKVMFKVADDFMVNDRVIIAKDTDVAGRIELISRNEIHGDPADIIVSNFVVKNDKKDIKLEGAINKIGSNRSVWVDPLGYGLGLFTGIGFAVWAVRGGHAKIKPDEMYALYYTPKL